MHGNKLREEIIDIIDKNRSQNDVYYDEKDKKAAEEIIKLFEKEFDITIEKGIGK